MKVRDEQVKLRRKMRCCRASIDGLRVPYGDLMGDDDALDRFRRTRKEFFKLGVAKRTIAKPRKMGKAAFADWMAKISAPPDPDKPLSDFT